MLVRMSKTRQVALLTFDGDLVAPTEIGRTESLNGQPPVPDAFSFGPETKRQRRHPSRLTELKNYYRHFKIDLALTKKELHGPHDPAVWQMKTRRTDDESLKGHGAELVHQQGNMRRYFSAVHAGQIFLHNVCLHAVRRAREIFGDEAKLSVHFTAPAYEESKRDTSNRYRAALTEITERLGLHPELEGVAFETKAADFLFEPYGVWQYFATVERAVSRRKDVAGQTFLIFDMGGSTTDLALVQVNYTGSRFHLYPICTSVEVAGEYYDRFLLMRLAGLSRLPQISKRWSETLEEIERAKVALCEGTETSVPIRIETDIYDLTLDVLTETTEALWRDPNREIGPGFRGFVQRALQDARKSGRYNEFDRIERVFLAGGSSQLPGLQQMIRDDLAALGLAESDDLFAAPRIRTPDGTLVPRTSLAALGQAAEMADEFQLERAAFVFARIRDADGAPVVFPRRALTRPRPNDGEVLLFSVDELADGEIRLERDLDHLGPFSRHGPFEDVQLAPPDRPLADRYDVAFRNNLQEDYDHSPTVPLVTKLEPGVADAVDAIEFSCHARMADGDVRVKPFLRGLIPGEKVRPRLHETAGSQRVSLRPPAVVDGVHICIDLGMNNTAVALYAPGRPFPSDADDLVVFDLDRAFHGDGQDGPPPDVPPNVASAPEPLAEDLPDTPLMAETPAETDGASQHADTPSDADARRLEAPSGTAEDALAPEPDTPPEAEPDAPADAPAPSAPASSKPPPMPASNASSPDGRASDAPRAGEWVHGLVGWVESLSGAPAATPAPTSRAPLSDPAMEGLSKAAAALSAAAAAFQQAAADRTQAEFVNPAAAINDEHIREESPYKLGATEDTSFEAWLRFVEDTSREQYAPDVLRQVWTRCKSDEGQLVVLAGPPGSGKSSLVRLLAQFFNRGIDAAAYPPGWEGFYLLQPVSPTWFSPANLLGAVNPLDGQFRDTPFLRFLMRAEAHYLDHEPADAPDRLFFACLDEFNIAQPEQYLSELLSRLEALPGSKAREMELCEGREIGAAESLKVDLTPNLRLFATLNTDASTKTLSPKVLDRCFFLRLTPTVGELEAAADRIAGEKRTGGEGLPAFHRAFRDQIQPLDDLSRKGNAPVGFRVLRQAYAYAAAHPALATVDPPAAEVQGIIAEVVASFFLPKLPGSFAVNSEAYELALAESPLRDLPGVAAVLDRVAAGMPGQMSL